jgi:hypothetical protein
VVRKNAFLNPIPFILGFQVGNRAGLAEGVCDTPLPFSREMNGIVLKPQAFAPDRHIAAFSGIQAGLPEGHYISKSQFLSAAALLPSFRSADFSLPFSIT